MPTTISDVRRKLDAGIPLTAITAYDYTTALSARRAGGIDVVFVLAEEVARCALGLDSSAAITLGVRLPRAAAAPLTARRT